MLMAQAKNLSMTAAHNTTEKTAELWYLAVWGASEINVSIQNEGGDVTGVIGRGIPDVLTYKAS